MTFPNQNRIIDLPDDEIRLSEHLTVIREGWRPVAYVAAAFLLIGSLYAVLATPQYRADAMIQVEDGTGSVNDALGQLASIFDTKQSASAEIELIRSRLVVGQTVHTLHLDISAKPRYFPLIGKYLARRAGESELASPYFGMTRFAWGGEKIEVSSFDVPETLYDKKFTLVVLDSAKFELRDPGGDVMLTGKTGQAAHGRVEDGPVELNVQRFIARPGTQFILKRASTLETINRLQTDLTIGEKTKQSGVIGVSLDGDDSQRIADIVNTIAAAYVQQNIDKKSAQAEHTLVFLDQQLPVLRKQLDGAEDRYNAFRNKNGTVDLTEESRLLLQQIVDTNAKIADLGQQRMEMLQRFTESHPAVAALNTQIASLQGQLEQLNKHVTMLPNTEQSALRLLRDVRVNTQLYMNLLNNAQQLRILKAGQMGSVRVVDYAVPQDEPIRPKRVLIIALALAFGLIAGVASVLARRSMFGGVEENEEIERALEIPVYAVVAHSDTQVRLTREMRRAPLGSQRVLAANAPHDVAIEGLRSLSTALQFGLMDSTNNMLVITGPSPGIGKSFTAVNLAAVLASSGKRVLLIDADMRRGDTHSYFGIARQPGLSDVIAGLDIGKALLRNQLPGLDVIPNGSLPPNPAELLMSKRFQSMLEELSASYDVVVIDTPPILAVTDAAIVGRLAGATLLVVRHGRHPVQELVESVNRLRSGGATLKGVLLTDVPKRRGGRNAYYGYESRTD